MVPLWFVPGRDRLRQRRRAQAEREGPVGVAAARRVLGRGRAARRRLQRRAGRQGGGGRAARAPRRRGGVASSARRRSRATSTRPAPRTASGCRRSAGRRTTWWCCPTPTSTWPPTRRSAPASARRASAAWRSRSWWRSTRSATTLVAQDRASGWPALRTGDGRPRLRHGPAGHRRPPRQGGRRTSTPASTAGATLVVDGRGRRSRTATPAASGSGRRCSTTSTPT